MMMMKLSVLDEFKFNRLQNSSESEAGRNTGDWQPASVAVDIVMSQMLTSHFISLLFCADKGILIKKKLAFVLNFPLSLSLFLCFFNII